jgi:predicted Fe-Mo cluster-binding NifX family protein
MKIAVPVTDNVLSGHFGHCTQFALFEVDPDRGGIVARQDLPAPEHQPGLLPQWLSTHGADVIIASGMGARARELFIEHQVAVVTGAPEADPQDVVSAYLAGTLTCNDVPCTEHESGCQH